MHAFTFGEVLTFLAFQFVIGIIVAAGVYLIQFGIGWHHWLGWTVAALFGCYSAFLYAAFTYDIIRSEYRIRFR